MQANTTSVDRPAEAYLAACDEGPHKLGDYSRLRHWCIFCGAFSWAAWWAEEDCPGGWACEDEDGCHARFTALNEA